MAVEYRGCQLDQVLSKKPLECTTVAALNNFKIQQSTELWLPGLGFTHTLQQANELLCNKILISHPNTFWG